MLLFQDVDWEKKAVAVRLDSRWIGRWTCEADKNWFSRAAGTVHNNSQKRNKRRGANLSFSIRLMVAGQWRVKPWRKTRQFLNESVKSMHHIADPPKVLAFTCSRGRPLLLRHCVMQMRLQTYPIHQAVYINWSNAVSLPERWDYRKLFSEMDLQNRVTFEHAGLYLQYPWRECIQLKNEQHAFSLIRCQTTPHGKVDYIFL